MRRSPTERVLLKSHGIAAEIKAAFTKALFAKVSIASCWWIEIKRIGRL